MHSCSFCLCVDIEAGFLSIILNKLSKKFIRGNAVRCTIRIASLPVEEWNSSENCDYVLYI